MKNKILFLFMALILVTSLAIAGCAAPAPEGPTELKVVCYTDPGKFMNHTLADFKEKVEAATNGELTISILGGAEVIAGLEQGRACQQGVVDIAAIPTSYYRDLVPASDMVSLAQVSYDEMRKPGGFLEEVDKLHAPVNLKLLSWCTPMYDYFYTFTNKEVNTPADLDGQKIGMSVSKYLGAFEELGQALVVVPGPEAYIALETGVVDGYNTVVSMFDGFSLHEVTNYMIDEGFFTCNMVWIMNLDSWNSLPNEWQDILKQAEYECGLQMVAEDAAAQVVARDNFKASGMEFIKFSAADSAYYKDAYYQTELERYLEELPDVAPKLAELLGISH